MTEHTATDPYRLFVGVDIAAKTASVAWLTPTEQSPRSWTIKQTPAGRAELHERLMALEPNPAQVRVVMEVTGAYWMDLALFLFEAGYAVSAINPAQAHHFAQALLQRAKTDNLDALTLAQLAMKLEPRLWTPAPPVREELYQRLMQRDYLLQTRKRMKNRLHALDHRPASIDPVRQRLEGLTDLLTHQIADIDGEMAQVLRQDVQWAATAAHLQTIQGIGLVTAVWLITATRNFTLCETAQQLVSFVGLAPYTRQSGTSLDSYRHVGHGGHTRLRQVLYMAALSAARFNPVIRAYYQHLIERGKNGKVATVAAARKLACIAWAVATKGEDFNPAYTARLPQATDTERKDETDHDSTNGI